MNITILDPKLKLILKSIEEIFAEYLEPAELEIAMGEVRDRLLEITEDDF